MKNRYYQTPAILVICPYNERHRWPLHIKEEEGKIVVRRIGGSVVVKLNEGQKSFEEYCPFCERFISITLKGK